MLKRSSIVPGIVVTITAILLFLLTAFFNEKYPLGDDEAQAFKPYFIPVLFWISSIDALIFVIYSLADQGSTGTSEYWVSIAWLGSLLLLIIGMVWITHWKFAKWGQIKEWMSQNKQEILVVTTIILVGAFLRAYILTLHPFPWSASVGTEASQILKGKVTNFFGAGWSGQSSWSFVPSALAEIIFGQTILTVRVVSMLEGTLPILFTYLLARELFENKKIIALLAAGFMLAFLVHLRPDKGKKIVAIPKNRTDLANIQLKYPGGKWESVQRRFKQEVLYYAYLIPPT
ncbi:MAG: hypothetical protein ABSA01_07345 [Anaerolineales bacterium]|jgi:hypothetical protein